MHEKNEDVINSISSLTTREKEILSLIVEGHNKNKIAESLNLSAHTVNTHIRNIFIKLNVHSRVELMLKVFNKKESEFEKSEDNDFDKDLD